ncbi:MAG: acyl carrier protein [Myxococcales bacterium]
MPEVIDDVKKILSKFARNKPALETAGPTTRIRKDLGVSSANLVDVLLEFEDTFGISISDDELGKIETLGDAVSIIESKKGVAKAL